MWSKQHGKHFKKIRRQAGFSTQLELAESMGYKTKQVIYLVESGRQDPTGTFRTQALSAFQDRLGGSLEMTDIFLDVVVDKPGALSDVKAS